MKIFSNEYQSNVSKLNQPAKGGPANFGRIFCDYLDRDSSSHLWQGLLVEFDAKISKCSLRQVPSTGSNKIFYRLLIPTQLAKSITRAKKANINPRVVLAEPISRLVKLLNNLSPDIVFLNGFSLGNWILLEAAHQAHQKIIIQHAGIWSAELDIYQDFFTTAGIKIMKQMEMDSATLITAEIFLNDYSRQYFSEAYPELKRSAKHQVKIIPLAVDFRLYQGQSDYSSLFNFQAVRFNIGVVARWDRIKNHQAIANLATQIKALNLAWSINSVTTIPATKKNIKLKKQYQKNIAVTNYLSKEGIGIFCSANDLIIIPSKFDVSPTILLEAIASGTPVAISKSVGFVDDYRRYGADDWIIDFDHNDKAIKQLKRIKGRAMPVKLTKALMQKHQANKVFVQYLRLFKKILA